MVIGRLKVYDAIVIGLVKVWVPVWFQVRDSIVIGVVKVWVKVRFQVPYGIDLVQVLVPEEQAEDWEGADVDAASGDSSKNSPDESG